MVSDKGRIRLSRKFHAVCCEGGGRSCTSSCSPCCSALQAEWLSADYARHRPWNLCRALLSYGPFRACGRASAVCILPKMTYMISQQSKIEWYMPNSCNSSGSASPQHIDYQSFPEEDSNSSGPASLQCADSQPSHEKKCRPSGSASPQRVGVPPFPTKSSNPSDLAAPKRAEAQ